VSRSDPVRIRATSKISEEAESDGRSAFSGSSSSSGGSLLGWVQNPIEDSTGSRRRRAAALLTGFDERDRHVRERERERERPQGFVVSLGLSGFP
jgi:hypothetical protein